jgi:hypothetical protein
MHFVYSKLFRLDYVTLHKQDDPFAHNSFTDLLNSVGTLSFRGRTEITSSLNACCISISLHFFHLRSLINLNFRIHLGC